MKVVTLVAIGSLVALSARANGQSFVLDPTALPTGVGIDSPSADVDFGDCDLDGDWDIAVACGSTLGFPSPDNCRIFINRGGLQAGVVGQYQDETTARFPSHFVNANDIEWVDIDGDGDADLHITTDARNFNHGSKWFVNQGGGQGGTLGYFVDETKPRWVGLGAAGSSIPSSYVVASGGFIDYGYDGSFADLDADGDLDLFHTTIGSPGDSTGANTPCRIFLNDGGGHFAELNPSGAVAANGKLVAGQPALWAAGVYAPTTLATDGSAADIAMTCMETDLGDIDGDLDIDVISADRTRSMRCFVNQIAQSGTLGFVDKTGSAIPFGTPTNSGQVSHAFVDLDNDGDLDLAVARGEISAGQDDCLLVNDGSGVFTIAQQLGPLTLDWEVDVIDLDNDGRTDLVFSEMNPGLGSRVRRNAGGGAYPIESLHVDTAVSGDADACDVDLDGDWDLVFADWNSGPVRLLRNVTSNADAMPPEIFASTTLGAATSAPGTTLVQCCVRDNAPLDLEGSTHVELQCRVDGWTLPQLEMSSSVGIGTAALPANLMGTVEYAFVATDEHGNVGATNAKSTVFGSTFGFASGYGVAGTFNGVGGSPVLQALSVPFAGNSLYLGTAAPVGAGTPVVVVIGAFSTAPLAMPGLLTANVLPPLYLMKWTALDASGKATVEVKVPQGSSGVAVFAQSFVLAPSTNGELLTGTKGLQLVLQ